MKYNGTLSKQQINQYTLIDYALMDRYTYYPSPLLVFGSNGYSKHYFIEGQRVMSRIGDIWDAEAALIPLDTTPDGVDLNNKADQIEAQLETHLACLALAGEVDYHVDLEWLGWETEPMVFFYHPDHLGSSSFITDATGEPTQHLEYLPFGELFIEERSTWNTPYKFSAKELDDETGYSYFGARYYDPSISIWLSVDPLSDKYPGLSPFSYCANNPIRFIDPDGRDWAEVETGSGKDKKTEIQWFKNKEAFEESGQNGRYLGEAVVVFSGSNDEKLGNDGTLTGEGANPASVTIYGVNGAEDINIYSGMTVPKSSDYSTLNEGDYTAFYQDMATSIYGEAGAKAHNPPIQTALTYRIKTLDGSPLVGRNNGKNVTMEGVFFHRTDWNGKATNASKGCPVVDGRSWRNVEKQLGKSANIFIRIAR